MQLTRYSIEFLQLPIVLNFMIDWWKSLFSNKKRTPIDTWFPFSRAFNAPRETFFYFCVKRNSTQRNFFEQPQIYLARAYLNFDVD